MGAWSPVTITRYDHGRIRRPLVFPALDSVPNSSGSSRGPPTCFGHPMYQTRHRYTARVSAITMVGNARSYTSFESSRFLFHVLIVQLYIMCSFMGDYLCKESASTTCQQPLIQILQYGVCHSWPRLLANAVARLSGSPINLWRLDQGDSYHGGTPHSWMVYNGHSLENRWFRDSGVPPIFGNLDVVENVNCNFLKKSVVYPDI